jgi:hypothetical protein
MADEPEHGQRSFTPVQQALDAGYEAGQRSRNSGCSDGDLEERRRLVEASYLSNLGPNSGFYNAWSIGFDAGYLGERKPALCL